MQGMNLPPWTAVLVAQLTAFGLKLLGAVAIWIVGRRLISLSVNLAVRAARRQSIDETLVSYIGSGLRIVLDVVLVVAILGFFGVETTTFAALLAGAGLAIGTAWGGILTNFAAGVFLVGLRPFRAGEFVTVAGVTGTVVEIGLLATVLNTPDNIRTVIGNGKILADTIQNYSANPYRRVDLVAQLHHTVDPAAAIALLRERVPRIPNVLADPAPAVEILEFTPSGPRLAVRPFCNNANYWQVYFDTNRAIRDAFAGAGYPAPEQLVLVRSGASS
jgi:small conductance mechanosensitive channel